MKAPTKRGPKKWQNYKAYPESFHDGSKWMVMAWQIQAWQLDAMAERMARAICKATKQFDWNSCDQAERDWFRDEASAALRSIGLSSPTSAAGKGEKL